ncbi:hypothetical protein JHW45_12835 [Paracoccus stylophorae]|uniref:DUF2497 domain-containing protein n=1 Tax=Paracoccus stylophorae TaxID=659350 RepID=A0ABY7SSF9_9RHOB|nr:hypothetical protein [Paracoccus stylophorae]WCR09950.1 hypothetical protein JHW45_12835 [Paracoccus stylophorae]
MADHRASPNAARLSEDIGDVLSAIRRLIAEDEGLTPPRDRPDTPPDAPTIDEDAGEFLARRHGGNAALARRLVGDGDAAGRALQRPADLAAALCRASDAAGQDGDPWPLGQAANDPGAARPRPVIPETPIPNTAPPPQRDARPGDRAAQDGSGAPAAAHALRSVPSVKMPQDGEAVPLRLDASRRVEAAREEGGWRGWLRSRPRTPAPVPETVAATPPARTSVDDNDFAEAFDWKARMRPDLPAPVQDLAPAAAAHPAEDDTQDDSAVADIPAPDFAEVLDAVTRADAAGEPQQPQPPADAVATQDDAGLAAQLSEQRIRDLLRDMIQEELHGELGERFSRNLRAVIRREVAAAIDDQLDRL